MTFSTLYAMDALILAITVLNGAVCTTCTVALDLPECNSTDIPTHLVLTPAFLVVPTGTEVTFECRALQCLPPNIIWTLDGEIVRSMQTHDGSSYRRTIVANQSIDNISCHYNPSVHGQEDKIRLSNVASLQVIDDCPVPSNLDIQYFTGHEGNQNKLKLQWMPPCIWPGHCIDEYYVTVQGRHDGSDDITYELTVDQNSTGNASESLSLTNYDLPNEDEKCTELSVTVMAFNGESGLLCKTLTNKTRLFPLSLEVFDNKTLEPRVFFRAINGTIDMQDILVKISFEMPVLCSFQELEYTIMIYDINNNTLIRRGPSKHSGSMPQQIELEFNSGFVTNTDYSVEVRVNTPEDGKMIISKKVTFDTNSAPSLTRLCPTILILSFLISFLLFLL